ncbi:Peptidyl-prolyl cis-trans isomerase FKBP8 [Ooceraea biroi]|uniref:peptidylprolyl isomerase n=2 Tax=Ooceraea biroi TaxID=2015173 RepID=A0A026VTP3_OOCBI|nr:Peptidyl-prolyl cis-trans isomerase FKBP8 [Ooceraea biroi]
MAPASVYCDSIEDMENKTEKKCEGEVEETIVQAQGSKENENENVGEPSSAPKEEIKESKKTPEVPDCWQDVLGNCQLMKKIIKEGKEWTKPVRGDICTVNITGRFENSQITVEEHTNLEIIVGDGDIVQGLDLVIVLMNIGEVADVIVEPRFAYGLSGTKDIPAGTPLVYTVELLTARSFDITQFNYSQRKELAQKKRLRGNWWYDRKELYAALECYKRVLVLTSMEELLDAEVTQNNKEEMLKLSLVVRNNMAMTQIRLGLIDAALENLNCVLHHEPNNVKALHRKAKLLADKGECKEAHNILLELQNLVPHMKILQVEISALADTIVANAKKEKSLYRRMLGISGNANSNSVLSKKKEDKNGINKKMLWSVVGGASAVIFSIIVHKFVL